MAGHGACRSRQTRAGDRDGTGIWGPDSSRRRSTVGGGRWTDAVMGPRIGYCCVSRSVALVGTGFLLGSITYRQRISGNPWGSLEERDGCLRVPPTACRVIGSPMFSTPRSNHFSSPPHRNTKRIGSQEKKIWPLLRLAILDRTNSYHHYS
jgi:hypothetical protein